MRSHESVSPLVAIYKRAWLIVLCSILTAAAATAISLTQEKEYSATASLLFRDPGFSEQLFGTDPGAPPDPIREAATNVKLVGLEVVADRTARKFGGNLSGTEISDTVTVAAEGQSDVVSITAIDPKPERARNIANTFARQFVNFRAATDRSKLLRAQRLAERQFEELPASEQQGARGESLSRAAERLGVLASLQTGNAELVQPAELPDSPSSPKPVRNGILGGLLGLLLGIGLAFLFERFNRRITDPHEVEHHLGYPLLGYVPATALGQVGAVQNGASPIEEEFEAFRILKLNAEFLERDEVPVVLVVTSPVAEEGKSTVAAGLAAAHAIAGKQVLLVDGDLRRPVLAERLGLNPAPGLSDYLGGDAQPSEILQMVDAAVLAGETTEWSAEPETTDAPMVCITAGRTTSRPAELLGSERFAEFVTNVRGAYDLVVFDSAPLLLVGDTLELLTTVDGVLVCVRLGQTTRDEAAAARAALERLPSHPTGVVVTGVKPSDTAGYYGGYQYARPLTKR